MSEDKLLGLDPADFGTTGLTLGLLIGIAYNEPERVLERGRQFGRGGGAETVQSWKLHAVQELLRRHGVDLDTPFRAGRPEPASTAREVVLERVLTDDDALRAFEPAGVGTGFLSYDPNAGDKGTVTFDRVNRPDFDADREAAICHDLLQLRDENAVYDRLEYLYRRILGAEARPAAPKQAEPIDPRPGDVWHDVCPSFTGGQFWHARDDGNGGVELYEKDGPGLVRADAVKSMRGGMTLVHREPEVTHAG